MSFPVFISVPSQKESNICSSPKIAQEHIYVSTAEQEHPETAPRALNHGLRLGAAEVGLITAQSRGKGRELYIPLK